MKPGREGKRIDRVIAAHGETEGISADEVRHLYATGASMGRLVDPEDIADIAVYLCCERGKRISGPIIGVDGHSETLYPRKFD